MHLQYCILALILSLTDLSNGLTWYNISRAIQRGALCNDYSPAGYFIQKNHHIKSNSSLEGGALSKWVIFLEGGGGCTTPRSCNERFIEQSIRKQYTKTVNGSTFANIAQAWNDYRDSPLIVTSKLMTTIWRFSQPYRRNTENVWQIQGRDLLSTDERENPDFYDYNHVLIPYCSSDLWLKMTSNYIKAQENGFDFHFDPDLITEHQFTFRGVAIFQSVIEDLFTYHGLSNAGQVLLGGSSAGGIGAMNHAGWLQNKLRELANPQSQLRVLLDSSWFINFQGSIDAEFAPNEIRELVEKGEVLQTCSRDNPLSCISAQTLLSNSDWYPPDIPTLVIFSRYDLYLLIASMNRLPSSDIIGIMRTVAEYAGSMNTSLQSVAYSYNKAGNLSYFVSSCFQHVYLASSTLWGEGELFGNEDIGVEFENNRFRHIVSSGHWRDFHLRYLNGSTMNTDTITIRQAIHVWTEASKYGRTVKFQDICKGPHCNRECPETVVLGELSPYWNIHFRFILMGVVMFISMLCLLLKVGLSVYVKLVERLQNKFLQWDFCEQYEDSESVLPYCQDEDAISVACLNLRYSVTVSKSSLNKAKTPLQRKRLLSVAAAIDDEYEDGVGKSRKDRKGWRDDTGGEKTDEETIEDEFDIKLSRLDSETGQTIVSCEAKESDFAASIHQFQQQHNLAQKQLKRGGWKYKSHASATIHLKHKGRKKEIIKGVSTYFNPGELVAIMGPSGSGKTTFLDLLAGRRRGDAYQGEILVNGISVDKVHDWYVANTGYVLQLAAPYCEELTVRENITLAAQMRLPKTLSVTEKLDRVEKVMQETGLTGLASTPVGGNTGTGLSGGQKRRLCVALQLLSMPSLIFLDEPTSGLDASSSLELLTHLHRVASSNRAVILTIHQPRLEIFHMFDKIMLLCQGQVAYHGIPDKAYEVFLDAHKTSSLFRRSVSLDSRNPADVIMDMLGSEEERMAILSYYQKSDEPQAVENAIEEVCNSTDEEHLQQRRKRRNTAGFFNRLGALEARATKRAKLGQTLYLPVIFIAYGLLLATVYLQTQDTTSILTGFGVFSCASALFMFPIIYSYLQRAIEIFTLEYADGVANSGELVLQTYIRFTALALFPIVASSSVIYLLAIPYQQYSFWVFLQTTVFSISLNQTWVAMLVFVIAAWPNYAHRISPVLSAVAGFVGGFFVPPKLMPTWYGWLYYINPNFYGFTAVSRVLLESFEVDCPYESDIECYPTSALYILSYFSLDTINPYLNVVVLLGMTLLYLLLAWTSLTLRESHFIPRLRRAIVTKWKLKKDIHSDVAKTTKNCNQNDKSSTSKAASHSHIQTSHTHFSPDPTLDSTSSDPVNDHQVHVTINMHHSSEERETNADDVFSLGTESPLFKKVKVQSRLNSEEGEDCITPLNDPGTKTSHPRDRRIVSFSDEPPQEGEAAIEEGKEVESRSGAGLRRILYRHRQTISKMLHDGENHEVWRPGMRRPKKMDSQESLSLEEKRKSFFHRINTYREGGPEMGGATPLPSATSKTPPFRFKATGVQGQKGKVAAVPANLPNADNIRRRIEQWKRIEEEALKMDQEFSSEQEVVSSEALHESVVAQSPDNHSPTDVKLSTSSTITQSGHSFNTMTKHKPDLSSEPCLSTNVKQEVRRQPAFLTCTVSESGSDARQLSASQTPQLSIQGQNCGKTSCEQFEREGSNGATEAIQPFKTVPASTNRWKRALKTEEGNCDRVSSKDRPTPQIIESAAELGARTLKGVCTSESCLSPVKRSPGYCPSTPIKYMQTDI